MVLHDSDQLELDLFPGEPWQGRSPRALTRVGVGFIFKPEGVEAREFFDTADQLLFSLLEAPRPNGEKPPQYEGAPLLLEPSADPFR